MLFLVGADKLGDWYLLPIGTGKLGDWCILPIGAGKLGFGAPSIGC